MNNIRACINLPGTCSDQTQKQVFLHREVLIVRILKKSTKAPCYNCLR